MTNSRGRLAEPEVRDDRVEVVLEAARTSGRDPDIELLRLLVAHLNEPAQIASELLVRDAD